MSLRLFYRQTVLSKSVRPVANFFAKLGPKVAYLKFTVAYFRVYREIRAIFHKECRFPAKSRHKSPQYINCNKNNILLLYSVN